MAEKELAILLRAKGATQAARDVGKVDSAVGKLGRTASQGLRTAGANIAKIGLIAVGGVALAVKGGLSSLAELETAVSSVDGAITQMGLAGKVTGGQVAGWANEIESSIGAAFDDKEITQATATLLRFGKVTPDNLRPAMVVMTDLATKTGDVDSAATLLAKALADPTKAAGKLAKSGVILTKAQQDQIKAFMKANKTAEAQKVILDALAETTKGAAAASQGPYKRAMSVLADVTEDAQKALATGFLPVIEKVAKLLSGELAKPSTIAGIKAFGQGLAGGLDSLITTARNLPWESIGDALRIGGMGAKAVLDAFLGMPPWVQTAVLTGWGLNKLTGGAIGGIVGQIGSGLIKGVLGMNAGVVNINAGIVNGAGGVPGGVPTGGGITGALRTAAKWIIPIAVAAAVVETAIEFRRNNPERGKGGLIRPVGGTWQREIPNAIGKSPAAALRSSGDPRLRPGALTGAIHASLDKLIGHQGGAFISAGAKNKTLDENAGKLVSLFRTSTNPSLKSMQDNLKILKATAAKGDEKTRKALSDDIAALNAMIAAKLAVIATNTANTAANILAHPGVPSFVNPGGSPPSGAPPGVLNITVNASVNANAMTTAQRHTVRMGGPRRVTAS